MNHNHSRMTDTRCFVCNGVFKMDAEDTDIIGDGFKFCCIDHLRQYVESVKPDEPVIERITEKVADTQNTKRLELRQPERWSELLQCSFRSAYEVNAAEVMCRGWGWWDIFYEPHAFLLFDADTNLERQYVPDFYKEKNALWLEVKGNFLGMGRAKFMAVQTWVGRDRLILVPGHHFNEFRKEAEKLRAPNAELSLAPWEQYNEEGKIVPIRTIADRWAFSGKTIPNGKEIPDVPA